LLQGGNDRLELLVGQATVALAGGQQIVQR
jgi:hypothetical protein